MAHVDLMRVDLVRIPIHTRRSAASRHDASPRVLDVLAHDPDPDVRMAVASHPATSSNSLEGLTDDAVARVAARARIRALARAVSDEAATG